MHYHCVNLTPFIWFLDVYIYRNLTLHVNKKRQPGINSQTQEKSLFEKNDWSACVALQEKKVANNKIW